MQPSLQQQVGAHVRRLRNERRWTQQDLAERAAMSVTYVGQLERGERDPGLGALKKLSDALGVDLAALVASGDPSDALGDLTSLSPEGRRLVQNVLREVQLYEAVSPRRDD